MQTIVSELITAVREDTENETFTDTVGLSDSVILRNLNRAQRRLQQVITEEHTEAFHTQQLISLVAGTKSYALNGDAYLNTLVTQVEYSNSGNECDYYDLQTLHPREIANYDAQYPCGYVVRNGNVIVSPVPQVSQGTLRVSYARKLDTLDTRRGTVESTTDDGTDYTTIVVASDTVLDATKLSSVANICIVNYAGVVQHYNIPVSSYSSSTRTLTLRSGAAIADGAISAGDYVVNGAYATTHSQLPDAAEDYLIQYASWRLLKGESSVEAPAEESELAALERSLVAAYNSGVNPMYPAVTNWGWV